MEGGDDHGQWPGASSWDLDPDPFSPLGDNTNNIDSDDACVAALRGESLPTYHTGAMSYTLQLCMLRGIRHHYGFATNLHSDAGRVGVSTAAFQRARHARAIMSNAIPDIAPNNEDETAYCIWYPDVASEDTYRALAQCYPAMRYQVGRACAVAGYSALYTELDLLPDISIAEEARDCIVRDATNRGSQAIYDHIVAQPVRWQVMDDYTRHVNLDNPPIARHGLNGDTAVVSTLANRRDFTVLREQSYRLGATGATLQSPLSIHEEPAPTYFNITEDWNIDQHNVHNEVHHNRDMLALLSTPLPHDLPWGNKDLLVLMAAYHGDVDRYARLRRPLPVSCAENHCINRGIYHSTAFAVWWSRRDEGMLRFSRSIHARFIMVNDLSQISVDTPEEDLPRQIWYPLVAQPATYLELARRRPSLRYVVARALIVAGYADAWDTLAAAGHVEPYRELMEAARASHSPHYLQTLERICAERGLQEDLLESKYGPDEPSWTGQTESTTTHLVALPDVDSVQWEQVPPLYDGIGVDLSEVELYMAASQGMDGPPLPAGVDELDLAQLYREQAGEITRGHGERGGKDEGEDEEGENKDEEKLKKIVIDF